MMLASRHRAGGENHPHYHAIDTLHARGYPCGTMRKPHPLFFVRATLAALFLAICGTVAAQQRDTTATPAAAFPTADAHKDTKLTSRIIDAPNGTFGYEVLSDDKLFVRQTNVPGRPGNEGCRTREQAEKLSALVIQKIQRGEMPPTVTGDELKSLGL